MGQPVYYTVLTRECSYLVDAASASRLHTAMRSKCASVEVHARAGADGACRNLTISVSGVLGVLRHDEKPAGAQPKRSADVIPLDRYRDRLSL